MTVVVFRSSISPVTHSQFPSLTPTNLKAKMVMCNCGYPAIVKTSWTSSNPGRRFYTCSQPGLSCRFIGWLDPPMCYRSMDIIPGLLKGKNVLEARLKENENEVKNLKVMLVFSWIFFVLVFVKMT